MCHVIVATLVAASLVGVQADVRPLSGPSIRGELVALAPEGIVVRVSGREHKLPTSGLWEVTFETPDAARTETPAVWIELTDGSRLLAAAYTATKGTAAVVLTSGQHLSIPTRSIRTVRLRDHSDTPEIARQWHEIVSEKPTGDVIVIRRPASLDQLEGILHDVTKETVEFEFEGEVIDVGRAKLDGFIYYHPATNERANRMCQVTDTSGCQWNAKTIHMAGQQIEVVTVTGIEVSLPAAAIEKIDFSSGNTVWLSDLEPESLEWRPYIGSRLPPSRLARLFHPRGGAREPAAALMLDGTEYAKGLCIQSRTEVVYRLSDDFRQFHAIVGIDDRVRTAGNVELVISGDGKVLFSKTITGNDPAFPLDLDLTGVRRLKILVDYGRQGDFADYLDLCDARLTK